MEPCGSKKTGKNQNQGAKREKVETRAKRAGPLWSADQKAAGVEHRVPSAHGANGKRGAGCNPHIKVKENGQHIKRKQKTGSNRAEKERHQRHKREGKVKGGRGHGKRKKKRRDTKGGKEERNRMWQGKNGRIRECKSSKKKGQDKETRGMGGRRT